jgi:hypothetical protein
MDESSTDSCDGTNDNCDSSGNNNHAAWNDNATYASGKFGNALNLDGTNDRSVLSTDNEIPSNWLGSNYTKRQPITITNTDGSTLSNYQVRLAVTYDSDMQTDFDDLRFASSSGTELDYWLESKTDSTSAVVWVEVDSITANGTSTIYMYYGDDTASTASSVGDTFINNSIFHATGAESDNIDNHSEADETRLNHAPSSTNYVTTINDSTGGDSFFRRYRYLFVADVTGTHWFGQNSDDGSESTIFPGDGYGGGYNTSHPFGAHTVMSYWYGGHGPGT